MENGRQNAGQPSQAISLTSNEDPPALRVMIHVVTLVLV